MIRLWTSNAIEVILKKTFRSEVGLLDLITVRRTIHNIRRVRYTAKQTQIVCSKVSLASMVRTSVLLIKDDMCLANRDGKSLASMLEANALSRMIETIWRLDIASMIRVADDGILRLLEVSLILDWKLELMKFN